MQVIRHDCGGAPGQRPLEIAQTQGESEAGPSIRPKRASDPTTVEFRGRDDGDTAKLQLTGGLREDSRSPHDQEASDKQLAMQSRCRS